MSTTTVDLIRDRAAQLVAALVPMSHAGDAFVLDPGEDGADFRARARRAPACFRWTQVRETSTSSIPEVSDQTVEETFCTLEVIVAYPANHRTGDGAAYRRDAVIRQDYVRINKLLGWCGRANFPAGSAYDACWRGAGEPGGGVPMVVERAVEGAPPVDFLVMRFTYSFQLALPAA